MIFGLFLFYGTPLVFIFALALVPLLRNHMWSWLVFLRALACVVIGMALPLLAFVGSALFTPEWKGGCEHGWIDCIHTGKLALLPVVLWSMAALYTLEVLRVQQRTRAWLVLGLFAGAITSAACLLHGLYATGIERELAWGFAVPLITTVWYGLRAAQLMRETNMDPLAYLWTLLATGPLWFLAAWWSQRHYANLPDQSPDCFVVTAAARGHRRIVGPLTPTRRGARLVFASRQLITLWAFEARWQQGAPFSHRAFRCVYNRVGPCLARRIRHPLLADAAHLALKPLEWAVRVRGGARPPDAPLPQVVGASGGRALPVERDTSSCPTRPLLLALALLMPLSCRQQPEQRMATPDFSRLDNPAILGVVYHPRTDRSPVDPKRDLVIPMADGVSLGASLHAAASPEAPLILFFHGNGEIASDYNDIAPTYNHLGISFLVVDYRGYGRSGGKPMLSNQLSDARAVWDALPKLCAAHGLRPTRTYVMGRSLGSASALEIGVHAGPALSGLIIESGFAFGLQLISRLGGVEFDTEDDGRSGLAHLTKIESIRVPTLIIHGEDDWIIPVSDARALHASAGATDKRLVTAPGAGHNDLLYVAPREYFSAVRDLVTTGE